MREHISQKDQFENLLKELKNSTTKHNVAYAIPLVTWTTKKLKLIANAEIKKNEAKAAKEKGLSPKRPLQVSRGEVWDADLGFNVGSEQSGSRPVLIVQNDRNNKRSPNIIVVPLSKVENRKNTEEKLTTEQLKEIENKLRVTETLLYEYDVKDGEAQLAHPSIVLCQNLRELSKERLNFRITRIKDDCWHKINISMKLSLGID